MIALITTPAHNIPYLFAAFAITWAVFFVYVFFTSRRQDELEQEMESLREEMRGRDGDGDGGGM